MYFFFFNDTATTEIYTLSLHDALPILVLNLPFKALMFLTLMRPSLVLFLVLWLKLVKDFIRVRSEERFSRNAETDLVCRLLLEKKNKTRINLVHPYHTYISTITYLLLL